LVFWSFAFGGDRSASYSWQWPKTPEGVGRDGPCCAGQHGRQGTREESLEKRLIFHGKMGGYIGKHQGKIMNSALSDGKHGKVSGNKLLFSLFEGQWTIHL